MSQSKSAGGGRNGPPLESLDPEKRKTVESYAKNGELACAVAFQIVSQEGMSAAEVGAYADAMKIRLVKCQMGLFGYQPEKKRVRKLEQVPGDVEAAIRRKCADNVIVCRDAWAVAAELGISKLAVANACETLSVKIRACQLGAF